MRVAEIYNVVVCEAHRHAKHANLMGSGGMPPRKITLTEIESEGVLVIYHPLMLLWTQVYKTP